MRLFGIILMVAAVGIFYSLFFMLAPYAASCVPDSSWHKLITLAIYVAIGWFGGIILPLVMFIGGLITFIKGFAS